MEAEIIKVQDMKDIEKLYPDEYEVSYLRDVKFEINSWNCSILSEFNE